MANAEIQIVTEGEASKRTLKEYADLWLDVEQRLERAGKSIERVYDQIEGLDKLGLQNLIKQLDREYDAQKRLTEAVNQESAARNTAAEQGVQAEERKTAALQEELRWLQEVQKARNAPPPAQGRASAGEDYESARQAASDRARRDSEHFLATHTQRPIDPAGILRNPQGPGGTTEGGVLARFNAAARQVAEGNEAIAKSGKTGAGGLDELGKGASRVTSGLNTLRSEALRLGDKGGVLQEILGTSLAGGPLGAVTLVTAAVTTLIAVVDYVTDKIRKDAERNLALIERLNAVNLTGLRGSYSEQISDLKKLQELKTEVDTQSQGEGDRLIKEQLGTGANRVILERRLQDAEYRARYLEQRRYDQGEDNSFNRAQERVRQAQGGGVLGNDTVAQLAALRKEYLAGGLTAEDYEKAVKHLERSVRDEAAASAESARFKAEKDAEVRERIALQKSQVADLANAFDSVTKIAAGNNPYVQIFEQADKRAEQFITNFSSYNSEFLARLKELNAEARDVELFRADLAGQDRLRALVDKAEALRNDPLVRAAYEESRGAARSNASLQASNYEQEARRLRGQTESDAQALRRRYNDLPIVSGISGARAIEELTRGASIETLRAAGLAQARAASLDDLAGDTRRRQYLTELAGNRQAESTERAIRQIEERLANSKLDKDSPAYRTEQADAADFILGLLGRIDPSKMPPALLQSQLKYAEQRAGLERSLRDDAAKQEAERLKLMQELKEAVAGLPLALKSASIVELRDRTALGTFTIERVGGESPSGGNQ